MRVSRTRLQKSVSYCRKSSGKISGKSVDSKSTKKLEDFKYLIFIADVRSGGKRHQLTKMKNSVGDIVEDKKGMLDVFSEFYGELYKTWRDYNSNAKWMAGECDKVPAFTADEVEKAVMKLAKKKAGDQHGIVAEILHQGGKDLYEQLAILFTDVTDPESPVPDNWRESRIKVLFKKGAKEDPSNYRPITILPILYKLFSKLVCSRIRDHIEKAQPVDQAGFRSGFCTEDHIFAIVILLEKMAEHNLPLWVAAIDFQKAFDTIEHESLWLSLAEVGVPMAYVRTLASLYSNQRGMVVDGCVSKPFEIRRGTKQGDPLSPALFNAVLQKALQEIIPVWNKRGCGIQLGAFGNRGRLCNLRFADDLLIIATSKRQLAKMLQELVDVVGRVGLVMHAGKTKILTNVNNEHRSGQKHILINGQQVDVLPREASTMYLGWALSFEATHDTEIHNRINKAWAKFMSLEQELCCKKYSLRSRLKLFDAVITPTILYASGTWSMTAHRELLIRSAQRRMLRKVLGMGRLVKNDKDYIPSDDEEEDSEEGCSEQVDNSDDECDEDGLETWTDWIRRVTHRAEQEAAKANVTDWVQEQRNRKWRWAGHTLRRDDGRWTRKVLEWTPTGRRSVGHPARRWEDGIKEYLQSQSYSLPWAQLANDRKLWKSMCAGFVARRW